MFKNLKLQHIGIPVADIEASLNWYKTYLGGEVTGDFVGSNGIHAVFVKAGDVVYELYRFPDGSDELAACKKTPGRIDHIAYDVNDVDRIFEEAKSAGLSIIEGMCEIKEFWEKGCRYFIVSSQDGTKIEFNEVIK